MKRETCINTFYIMQTAVLCSLFYSAAVFGFMLHMLATSLHLVGGIAIMDA